MYVLIDRIQGGFQGYQYLVNNGDCRFPTPKFTPLNKCVGRTGFNDECYLDHITVHNTLEFAKKEKDRNEKLIKEQVGIIVNLMVVPVQYLFDNYGSIKDFVEE